MKCPICEQEITDVTRDYMDSTLTEEQLTCKDEHHFFHSMYAYGSTQETIGSVTFTYHYTDTKEKRDLVNHQFIMVATLEREVYRKKKKGVES